jgi:ERCC4-type nuclease
MQAIVNKQFRDGFKIIHTSGMDDTVFRIYCIIKTLKKYGFRMNNSKCGLLHKKRSVRNRNNSIVIKMLGCINGVSYSMAEEIMNNIPGNKNIFSLMNYMIVNGKESLSKFKYGKRTIGNKISIKIFNTFLSKAQ